MIRFAAIGCGRVLERIHLPAALDHADVEVVGLCDADIGRAEAVRGDLDLVVGTDPERLLADVRPDVVSICTPNAAHEAGVAVAVAAGARVLCEKPLAATVDGARRVAALGEGSSLVGVNLPYRFDPLVERLAGELPDGPVDIRVVLATPGLRLWRPVSRWYDDPLLAGAGVALDLGVHAVDLLDVLVGPLVGEAVDGDPVGERCTLRLGHDRGSATVELDRASRRIEVVVEASAPGGTARLDLRSGTLERDGMEVATGMPPPAGVAVTSFLDVAAGRGGRVVPFATALRHQVAIEACLDGVVEVA